MSSARTLSTNELGATRYSQAASTNTWPVQICITPTPSFSINQYKLVIEDGVPDAAFSQTWHGDIRATVALPVGKRNYKVYRDSVLLFSEEIHVQPGEPPLGTTKLASELTERRPSGVTQIEDSEHGKAAVRFVYTEETHSAREVYAIGDGVNVKLQRDHTGDFVGQATLQVGDNHIRFRVVPREWTRPDVAAFTKLGWDDSAGERGVLVTWPLSIHIQQRITQVKEEAQTNHGDTACSTCGGLGMALAGVVIGVTALAVAIVLRRGKESVDEDVVEIPTTNLDMNVDERKREDAETDVISHLRSMSL